MPRSEESDWTSAACRWLEGLIERKGSSPYALSIEMGRSKNYLSRALEKRTLKAYTFVVILRKYKISFEDAMTEIDLFTKMNQDDTREPRDEKTQQYLDSILDLPR